MPSPTWRNTGSRNGTAPAPMRKNSPPHMREREGRQAEQRQIDAADGDDAAHASTATTPIASPAASRPRRRCPAPATRAPPDRGCRECRPPATRPSGKSPRQSSGCGCASRLFSISRVTSTIPMQPDRHVEEEHPAPRHIGRDEAADRRPEHRPDEGRDHEIGHGAHIFRPLDAAQQHEPPDRHHHRAAHALDDARGDELAAGCCSSRRTPRRG